MFVDPRRSLAEPSQTPQYRLAPLSIPDEALPRRAPQLLAASGSQQCCHLIRSCDPDRLRPREKEAKSSALVGRPVPDDFRGHDDRLLARLGWFVRSSADRGHHVVAVDRFANQEYVDDLVERIAPRFQ
jgi:hypothetical protein